MSDIEYGDEEDDFYEDEWYDQAAKEADSDDDYDYESDHYYDGDGDDEGVGKVSTAVQTRRRNEARGSQKSAKTPSCNQSDAKLAASMSHAATALGSVDCKLSLTSPVIFARVDPGLATKPAARCIYQPGTGEVVALLKNWRQIFADARPTFRSSTRQRAGSQATASRTRKQTDTTAESSRKRKRGSDTIAEPNSSVITAASLPSDIATSLATADLELRPTSPPPHTLDRPPSATAGLSPLSSPSLSSTAATTSATTTITASAVSQQASSPSPPQSSRDLNMASLRKSLGASNFAEASARMQDSRGGADRSSRKRKAGQCDSPETAEGGQPERKHRVVAVQATMTDGAAESTPVRRSARKRTQVRQ
ncbi:hypothetical protein KEM52_000630 [Ascosphaera acerosa]|nr:hypothetical protein KEM52_000630 [Ascosphaera acerosa]